MPGFSIGFWIFCFAVIGFSPAMPAQEPAPGLIHERVICRGKPDQSYALYLPSNYSPDRKWPILYALDAGARGSLPVMRFRAAAEKYGYIVAGSNNSQNGSIRIVEESLGALFADTETRFALDNRRVYLTGFSGGARVAIAAAVANKGKVAGVIGCGAGFPPSLRPQAPGTFAFFGTAGAEDFNFPELRSLDDTLEKLGFVHRFEVFKGGHDWPPESVCTSAVKWLELQAIKSGLKAPDAGLIDQMYSGAAEEARTSEGRQEIYDAYQRYSALAKDFAGLKDVREFETRAVQLGKSQEVRKALNQEKTAGEKQARLRAQLNGLLTGSGEGTEAAFQLQAFIQKIAELRAQSEQTRNEVDRLVARRVLTEFWVQLNELWAQDYVNGQYAHAARRLELMTKIRPENPGVFYNLACASARAGNRKKALKALNDALVRGFRDLARLQTDPDFESVREDPGFQKILEILEKRP